MRSPCTQLSRFERIYPRKKGESVAYSASRSWYDAILRSYHDDVVVRGSYHPDHDVLANAQIAYIAYMRFLT